jgi:hypothetical protein
MTPDQKPRQQRRHFAIQDGVVVLISVVCILVGIIGTILGLFLPSEMWKFVGTIATALGVSIAAGIVRPLIVPDKLSSELKKSQKQFQKQLQTLQSQLDTPKGFQELSDTLIGIQTQLKIQSDTLQGLQKQLEASKESQGQSKVSDAVAKWGVVNVEKGDVGHEFRHEIRKLKKGDEICINALTGYHIITSEHTELIKAALRGAQVKIIVADMFTAEGDELWQRPLLRSLCPENEDDQFNSAVHKALSNLLYMLHGQAKSPADFKQLSSNLNVRLAKTMITSHTVILKYKDGEENACYYASYLPCLGSEGFVVFSFTETTDQEASCYACVSESFHKIWDEGEPVSWDTKAHTFKIRANKPEDREHANSEGYLTIVRAIESSKP